VTSRSRAAVVKERRGVTGRVKGFAAWRPHKKTEALLVDIERVLEEYRAYLPMTVRQVFYRLVGKGYPKSESFYDKVLEACLRARRSRRISFAAIRDDGVSRLGGESGTYESPQEYYERHEEISNTKYVCIMTDYAKDDKARAAPELQRVGEPLSQSPRSCLAHPLPDPLAHK
jgi:hypothetical protein